jgi:UDP-N-acetylglucosamine--N-acetylmuramyl-(pentapeptide) pyrophosphoryl-undecaprenol N-acetylglucosamine transferase
LKSLGFLRVKIFLHEQNVTPGKLNLLASKIADKVMITFPQSASFFGKKAILTGYPVRKFGKNYKKEDVLEKLKIPPQRKVIFAFGGSQGSRTINRCVVSSLKYFLPCKDKIFVILSCGIGQSGYNGLNDVEEQLKQNYNENELAQIKDFFKYEPYFYNIDEVFSIADLVIARSGAGTLFEISSFELPSILIPKVGLANEHQVMNAMAMEDAAGAEILFEKPSSDNSSLLFVDGKTLAEKAIDIAFSEDKLNKMKEGTRKFFSCPDILTSLRKIILEGKEQKEELSISSPFSKLKPPSRLLSFLQQEKEKEKFKIENLFKESEINFYRSLTLKLLFSKDWKEKNIGVKLAAFFKTEESKHTLLEIATNKEKAPFINRVLGEPLKNVGFLRRNSLLSLREYDLNIDELTKVLKEAFSDSYYETRSASLLLARKNSAKLSNDREFINLAKSLSKDSEFEVAKEAILLLGEIGSEEDLTYIISFKDHFFWQVREAALLAIKRIIERGVKIDKEKVKKELLKFNLTSTDFKPLFTIKQNYRKICELLEKE